MFIKPVYSKIASSPTKFAEALACGLPVVINSGIGDTGQILQENKVGVVIPDFTPACYLESVRELLSLIQEDKGLSARCRQTAQQYLSLEQGVESYREVYQEALYSLKAVYRNKYEVI
jgi:glycosyltransferase involved in cell wall biosynthesis